MVSENMSGQIVKTMLLLDAALHLIQHTPSSPSESKFENINCIKNINDTLFSFIIMLVLRWKASWYVSKVVYQAIS